jgi:hypothetical protein
MRDRPPSHQRRGDDGRDSILKPRHTGNSLPFGMGRGAARSCVADDRRPSRVTAIVWSPSFGRFSMVQPGSAAESDRIEIIYCCVRPSESTAHRRERVGCSSGPTCVRVTVRGHTSPAGCCQGAVRPGRLLPVPPGDLAVRTVTEPRRGTTMTRLPAEARACSRAPTSPTSRPCSRTVRRTACRCGSGWRASGSPC